ncbi:hypothetical protein C4553_00375 [Candidatus Parcubacteria bacterium]|nr:MAG: hypothetical protein C4553_00375 [Candidatus Parcubacteria bacterium]
MKRKVYIGLFVIFALGVAFLFHMLLEISVIDLLARDFELFGLGLSWQDWFFIHKVAAVSLEILGFFGGIYFGKKFANYFHY